MTQTVRPKGEWRLVEEYKPDGSNISFRMAWFPEGWETPEWSFWAKWDGCYTLTSHANGSTIEKPDECDDNMHFCNGGSGDLWLLPEILRLGAENFGPEYWEK